MISLPRNWSERLERLLGGGGRRLLGIVGPPGSGKSTLAESLAAAAGNAVVVPMDGFHLANVELARLGRAQRKGAEDTFDSGGYVALLRRLREAPANETVYAPTFRREIEEAVAGAIAVPADAALVVTEGNYLLLDTGAWSAVRGLLDEVWYLDVDPVVRRERLLARHIAYGRTAEEAESWVAATDDPNARRIEATRPRADFIANWTDWAE